MPFQMLDFEPPIPDSYTDIYSIYAPSSLYDVTDDNSRSVESNLIKILQELPT